MASVSGLYTADALPQNATPAWTKTNDVAPTTESVSSGIFSLKTASGNYSYYTITDTGGPYTWHAIEASIKYISAGGNNSGENYLQLICRSKFAAAIQVESSTVVSTWYYDTQWRRTSNTVSSTSNAFHTYRIVGDGTTTWWYFDGTLLQTYASTQFTGSGNTTIRFGDGGNNIGASTDYQVDYVSYYLSTDLPTKPIAARQAVQRAATR